MSWHLISLVLFCLEHAQLLVGLCLSSNMGSFQQLFLQIFSLSFSSPYETPMMQMQHILLSRKYLRFYSIFFNLFFVICSDFVNSIEMSLSWLIISSVISTLLLSSSKEFFLCYCIFQFYNFLWFFFYNIYDFAVIFNFSIHFNRIYNWLLNLFLGWLHLILVR